jgi:hypothetical protein
MGGRRTRGTRPGASAGAKPQTRLPGAGGAPEIAASCREVIVVTRQIRRSFVDRVDFVTSVGFGAGPGDRARLGLTGAPVEIPPPERAELAALRALRAASDAEGATR